LPSTIVFGCRNYQATVVVQLYFTARLIEQFLKQCVTRLAWRFLTAVRLTNRVFLDVTQNLLVNDLRWFKGIYCLGGRL